MKSKGARKNENTIWTPGIGYCHTALSSLVISKRSVQSLKTVNRPPAHPNQKKNYSFLNTDFYGWAKCKVQRTPTEFGLPVLGRDREHGEIEFWQLEVICITSGRMLSSWHSPFKPVTSRKQNIVLKSEILILTLNNSANSLSLLSCHSSLNSVSIPALYQALLLNSFSRYQSISLAALEVKCVWYLHSLPIHLLISGHLLWTPDNSNVFQFSYKVSTVCRR